MIPSLIQDVAIGLCSEGEELVTGKGEERDELFAALEQLSVIK